MTADPLLVEMYFDWLRTEAFTAQVNRRNYEGVLRTLHDIPFYWTIWSDENRAGDALTYRQYSFLGVQNDLEQLDPKWLHDWAQQSPSVLEVLLGCARRYSDFFGHHVPYYFGHLFRNLELDRLPGRALTGEQQMIVRNKVDVWMSHQYDENGQGSPFPIRSHVMLGIPDMRTLDIWRQMNAYSAEHFQ